MVSFPQLIIVLPLAPLVAVLLQASSLCLRLRPVYRERFVLGSTLVALSIALLSTIHLLTSFGFAQEPLTLTWLHSDVLTVSINLVGSELNLWACAFSLSLLLMLTGFSARHLHRDPGMLRHFCGLNLFAAALTWTLLSSNMVMTFVGWQLMTLSAYGAIVHIAQSPEATLNATRVWMTHRLGDVGFLLAIGLSYSWTGSVEWQELITALPDLDSYQRATLSLCLVTAALARSAQLPFAAWLSRALEGPASSNAVFFGALFVHSGIFFIISLRPLLEASPLILNLLALVGALTLGYAFIVGLTQTDIKSALSFAITAQLGLMVFACGLGFWQLTLGYIVAHSIVRSYQLLHLAYFARQVRAIPVTLLPNKIVNLRGLFVVSMQRFWLDPLTDWLLVNPILRLGKDLSYFDEHIVNSIMGTPAPNMNALSTLAQLEEYQAGIGVEPEAEQFARGHGVVGKLTQLLAAILYWIEEQLIIQGLHRKVIRYIYRVGQLFNKLEQLLLRPRYVAVFLFITLLVVF